MSYVNALTRQFVLDRIRVDDAGCWIWTMALDQEGYAILGPGAQERRGHRLSYRLFVGDIPDDMTVDHICFVVNCVNPAHLQLLTAAENTARRPTRAPGERKVIPQGPKRVTNRTHCSGGHPWIEENLRIRDYRSPECRICANAARRERHARAR